ncbi:MAG: ABC transporter substrate-binding protein [Planctomycetaceae bacterium]
MTHKLLPQFRLVGLDVRQVMRVVCYSILMALAVLSLSANAFAQAETETPATGEDGEPAPEPDPIFKLEDMQVPSIDTLLNERALDWIILATDDVYVVESIVPRPNTLDKRKLEIERKQEERRTAPAEQRKAIAEELEELNYLYVALPDVAGNPERRIPTRLIKEIVHHEDLMMRRARMLLEESDIEHAFELISRLEKDWDAWPGLDALHNEFLLVDGKARLAAKNWNEALTIFRELYARDKQYAGLSQSYGQGIDALVSEAVAEDDFRRATFHLEELTARFAGHPVFQKYDAQFTAQVNKLIAEADAASASGDYRTATMKVEDGARIWPRTPALQPAYRKHALRYQRLHAGVLNLPEEGKSFFLPAPADLRVQPLKSLPLFEVNRMRDGTAYYRTRFLDEWEPYDLGRRMKFTLRQFRQPSDMHQVIGSPDVVTQLLRLISPERPEFDERLASYIENVTVHSPLEFTIDFRRVPPRIEPLLEAIRFQSPSASDESVDSDETDETLIGPLTDVGGFRRISVDAKQYAIQRALPEPDGLPVYHVAEIVEHKYENFEQAVQALSRGEVSILPELPDWIVRQYQDDEEFLQAYRLEKLELPLTQVLQFNPSSRVLRTRELRRGLAYAVDREKILKDIILRDEKMRHGRIITGPFFSDSPARHVLVEPRRYDISSAIAMIVAAKKILTIQKVVEEENLPRLKFLVEPGPLQEEAAKEMARVWGIIGVPVDIVVGTDEGDGQWDIMLRSLQMTDPLVEIWPFLTVSDRAQLSDLDDYPDWLKQEIVDLDRTSDQSRALERMQELHRHLWVDAALVPLWEVDQYRICRKTISDSTAKPIYPYDGVDHWTQEPWFSLTQ